VRQKERLIQLIESARRDVSEAEADLEKAMAEIIEAPRAEKITISAVVDGAFSKLRAAREVLADAERLVTAAPD
jgi:hypothetical protein